MSSIYQDLIGTFYINTVGSEYLLTFTYANITERINLYHRWQGLDAYYYKFVNNTLFYLLPEENQMYISGNAFWRNAIVSLVDGSADVELVENDFLEKWLNG